MILGEILSKIGNKPLDVLLREKVLDPMGLKNTTASQTSEIPSPVLHAFDSERRAALKIPANIPFYEESTFWNSQWGTPIGANQTTNIDDMITTAIKVGTGALISKSSYEAMTGPHLLGFGKKQDNCAPSCGTQMNFYNYGLGDRALGIMVAAEPDARRLQRDGGVSSLEENRHRRVRDLRAGSVRLGGELPQFQ